MTRAIVSRAGLGARMAAVILLGAVSMLGHSADLTVIYEGAGTVPLGTYYGHFIAGVDQEGVLPGTQFPLVSKLQPGQLASQSLGQGLFAANWMAHPVFVLGGDAISLQWLQQHRLTLDKLGASGLVIAASNERAFKEVQQLAGGLAIAPVRGQWLEQKLLSGGIERYPLVLMPDGRITSNPQTTPGRAVQ
jgi:integrating conjugative element protein (TIGR03765 family)